MKEIRLTTNLQVLAGLALIVVAFSSCKRFSNEPERAASPPSSTPLSRVDRFNQKRVCMEAGRRRAEEDTKDVAKDLTPASTAAAEYCFSESHNTCLYSGGVIGPKHRIFFVADLMTNKHLATHVSTTNGQVLGFTAEAFEQRRQELMRTCVE